MTKPSLPKEVEEKRDEAASLSGYFIDGYEDDGSYYKVISEEFIAGFDAGYLLAQEEMERLKANDPVMSAYGARVAAERLADKLAQQEAAAEKLCEALEFYNQAGTKIWNEDECGERAHRAIAAYREAVKKGKT